jgi:putative transposase
MLRGYKYRIYPNQQQRELLDKTFGCTRLVYNLGLECKITAYKSLANVNLSTYDLCYQLKELKEYYPFLSEVDSQALQASLHRLEKAFSNFYNGSGFPRFKSKKDKQSFTCPNNKREVDWDKETLTIPKIKGIPIVLSRKFDGKIKNVTISKTTTLKYYASILVDDGISEMKPALIKEINALGIDIGLKDYITLSDGIKIDNPKYLQKSLEDLGKYQRQASHKQNGSNNQKKAYKKVAKQYEIIKNKRGDFLHKLTTKLICDNQANTFMIEDLSPRNLMQNHNLALSIGDASWGEFYRQMEYKCKWYGKNLIKIGRFEPSSKRCHNCKHINEALTLSVRMWECENCHVIHDRDINAAINIKMMGLEIANSGSGKKNSKNGKQKIRTRKTKSTDSGAGSSVEPVEFLDLEGTAKQEKQKLIHKV